MEATAEPATDRSKFLGGSDAAAVLGLSRWKTPLQIWGEKTGNIVPEDISDRLSVKLGNRLEQVVVELFEEETGKKCRRVNEALTHPVHPFLAAKLDRRVVGEDAILEVKTASGWKIKEWEGDDIPQEYVIQVLHYLAVTGAKKAYIACLIGGNQKFVWKEILRDEKVLKQLVAKEVEFWNDFVVTKIMPTAAITKDDADTLFSLFPDGAEGVELSLGSDVNAIIEAIQRAEVTVKQAEDLVDEGKNRLRAVLGEASIGKTDKFRVTWKNQMSRRVDTTKLKEQAPALYAEYSKESASRVLRISSLNSKSKEK